MKVVVLGIGNVMFGDEGVGVHFVKMMEENFAFSSASSSIEFVDGGTLAMALSPIIVQADYLIVVDCISCDDAKAGDVFFFPYDAMPPRINWSGSAHEVEMLETLRLIELMGDLPPTKILAIVPTRVEPMSFTLSSAVQDGSKVLEKTLLSHLKELGFECKRMANFSVQDEADKFSKGSL